MPKRKWKVRQTVGQQHAAIRAANRTYRSDMAEAAKDQKDADKLLGQEKYLKMIRSAGKLLKHAPEMDKLKEQRKFEKRKNQL
jgi:hypothetical protein